jgi:BMFP domain-containing protein YqiC
MAEATEKVDYLLKLAEEMRVSRDEIDGLIVEFESKLTDVERGVNEAKGIMVLGLKNVRGHFDVANGLLLTAHQEHRDEMAKLKARLEALETLSHRVEAIEAKLPH